MANQEMTIQEIELRICDLKEKLKNVKGSECSVFTRIVGYYRATKYFNHGKARELKDRICYDLGKNKKKTGQKESIAVNL